ncbi:hypothetical protein ABT126_44195 [Streptomyces sp. NPDC002012]
MAYPRAAVRAALTLGLALTAATTAIAHTDPVPAAHIPSAPPYLSYKEDE